MENEVVYIGASKDLSHPSDRRGYPEFIKRISSLEKKNIYKKKIIILFLSPSNIEYIKEIVKNSKNSLNKNYRLIVIYVDFYHGDNNKLISKIKKIYRKIMYRSKDDYIDLINKIIKIADKLILGSSFQCDSIIDIFGDEIRHKVSFIEDYIEKDFINKNKSEQNNKNNLNIIWEGVGYGAFSPLIQLLIISYRASKKKLKPKIFFLTDSYISLFGRIVFPTDFLFKIINLFDSQIIYKKWTKENLIKYATLSQIAIIAINSMDRRSYYKNANKPRLLSALGLKYIFVPNIPDYKKLSINSKNIILFNSINELILKIKKLIHKNKKFEDSLNLFDADEHNIMVDEKWKYLLHDLDII